METMITLTDLCVGYGESVIVKDINLHIAQGSIVSLIGANGSGKSTLLKTLTGGLKPIAGQVLLEGEPVETLGAKELSKKVAILMTNRFQSGWMTSREIVELGRYPYTNMIGKLSDADNRAVETTMELLNIAGLSHKLFNKLSDGQRQLVMLARAICQEPKVLIMDEPTSFLDINYKLELMKIVKKLSEQGITIVMSLHELELAREISDRIVCIEGGRVFQTGTPSEIFSKKIIGEIFHIQDFGVLKNYLFS